MDEHEALLGRTARPPLVINELQQRQASDYSQNVYNEGGGSSSDGSDSWWGDSHSSCSSCTRSDSSDEDWEAEVTEDGELLYVEPAQNGEKSNNKISVNSTEDAQGEPIVPTINKLFNVKEGKFVRWIRRRESKRQRPRLSLLAEQHGSSSSGRTGLISVTIDLTQKCESRLSVSSLGIEIASGINGSISVQSLLPEGPLAGNSQISEGDCFKTVNGEDISMQNLDRCLSSLVTPCQVVLGFQKRKDESGRGKNKSSDRPSENNAALNTKLSKWSVAVLVLNVGECREDVDGGDLVFSFPSESPLRAARGAFLTLNHLLPTLVESECQSCTCEMNNEEVHVIFIKEDDLLFLLSMPNRLYRLDEACYIGNDIVRCIQLSHQTLRWKDNGVHQRFFSSVLTRLLSKYEISDDVPFEAMANAHHHFHEFLPSVPWVPLPREAQLQLDDALNELESCDFTHEGEEAVESDRQYIVIGSCLFHQGYLLASHLTKDDLLDVHSFLRQHGLLQLSRDEGVTRLVLWKEIFPHSVNRGLPPSLPTAYPPPVGRWFLLVVSTDQDMLAVVLESAGCCQPLPQCPRPHVPHVREAEDTLAHIQSLGLMSLAAQWLAARARPRTTAGPPVVIRHVKDKPWMSVQRSPGESRASGLGESQEDCSSHTTSNPSNASESDENAPILGRRAERTGLSSVSILPPRDQSDDSQSETSDSDSDWGSFKGLNIQDNGSGLFDNPYLPSNVGGLEDITPTKITAGPANLLFHFVHIDGNEGVVVTPGGEATPPSALMEKFTEAARSIHIQLQHNIRFRATSNPRGVVHKSLVAVKECGILIDAPEDSRSYWVVGRLFFCPKPREVYVCYSDDAPQNMLELSFRFGLNMAG